MNSSLKMFGSKRSFRFLCTSLTLLLLATATVTMKADEPSEHTDQVLKELLQMTAEELQVLRKGGVI